MVIAALSAFFLIFFGGGSDTFLLNPDLKKNVNTYVVDKDRKMEIEQVIKQVEQSQKSFREQKKKGYNKKVEALNMNRASTLNDFKVVFDNFYKELSVIQDRFLDSELKIRSLIKPNEWDSIMTKVLQTPDKEKTRKHLLKENEKLHDDLLKACEKHIPDAAGKEKARMIVDEYQKKGDTLTEAFLDLGYRYRESIRPYKVTRKDFEPQRTAMLKLRRSYTDYLVTMRFNLLEITPEAEWNGLARELNNNLFYLGSGDSK